MKKSSLRSILWLGLPCLILPLWIGLRHRADSSPITQITAAKRVPPSPSAFRDGADVGLVLEFDADSKRYSRIAWEDDSQIEAGGRVLWRAKTGRVKGVPDVLPPSYSGSPRDFVLKKVPASWGEVVYRYRLRVEGAKRWDTSLFFLPLRSFQESREGKIVLRRAGEKLDFFAQIDRNPHLKFVDYSLEKVAGQIPQVRLGVFYALLPPAQENLPRHLSTEMNFYQTRNGSSRLAFSESGGGNDFYQATTPKEEREVRRFVSRHRTLDLELLGQDSRLQMSAQRENFWPLPPTTMRLTDSQGRPLLKKSRLKISASCLDCTVNRITP